MEAMEPRNNKVKLKEFLSYSNESMILASINRKVEGLTTLYPKINFAQHMLNVLRSAGEVQGDPWYWKNDRLLKKFEQYEKKLSESYNIETGEYDLDDEPITEEWLKQREINNE